jgi:hypothetical protein
MLEALGLLQRECRLDIEWRPSTLLERASVRRCVMPESTLAHYGTYLFIARGKHVLSKGTSGCKSSVLNKVDRCFAEIVLKDLPLRSFGSTFGALCALRHSLVNLSKQKS